MVRNATAGGKIKQSSTVLSGRTALDYQTEPTISGKITSTHPPAGSASRDPHTSRPRHTTYPADRGPSGKHPYGALPVCGPRACWSVFCALPKRSSRSGRRSTGLWTSAVVRLLARGCLWPCRPRGGLLFGALPLRASLLRVLWGGLTEAAAHVRGFSDILDQRRNKTALRGRLIKYVVTSHAVVFLSLLRLLLYACTAASLHGSSFLFAAHGQRWPNQ